jgi:hypothetical protein
MVAHHANAPESGDEGRVIVGAGTSLPVQKLSACNFQNKDAGREKFCPYNVFEVKHGINRQQAQVFEDFDDAVVRGRGRFGRVSQRKQ